MANVLTDAQNNLRNWGRVYQTVRTNDERNREFTTEFAQEGNKDENGQVNPAGVLIEDEHTRMNSSLDASLLAVLQTFDAHLSISVGSSRNTFLDTLFDKNSADEDNVQVKSRGTTYNAVVAGTNTGNSVLYVCATDRNNDVIESATIETLTFKALGASDSKAGLGLEVWSVQGSGKDQQSEFLAGGVGTRITGINAIGPGRSSLLANPSWDLAFNGSGANKIQNWSIESGDANVALNVTDFAQDRGDSHGCLEITGNCVLRFDFRAENVGLTYLAPLIAGLMVELTGVTADIELRLGSAGTPYALLDNHAAATQVYTPMVLDPDTQNAWRNNFDTDGQPFLEIEVSNYSAGTIRLDDALCEAMTFRGGRWGSLVSGQVVTVEGDSHSQQCVLDTGAGSVQLTGGASGSVDGVTVDGVELLSQAVPFNVSLDQTASDLADEINSHRTFPNYIATVVTDTVTITQEVPVEGTLSVISSTTTITSVDSDVTGASLGEIQDSIVRRTGKYLPHAVGATSGWEDHG